MTRRILVLWLVGVLLVAVGGCRKTTDESGVESIGSSADTTTPATPGSQPSPLNLPTAGLVRVPDPLQGDNPLYPEATVALPDVGGSVEDPGLGTNFVRVTEHPGTRHEYSRHDPFNADKSMIILMDADGFAVYKAQVPYDSPENLVTRLDMEEPRWDRTDPAIVLGTNGFQLLMKDVVTGESTIVKDFAEDPRVGPIVKEHSDLYRITMKDEGEASWDGRWWAFAMQGSEDDYRLRYVFTWDRAQDVVLGVLEVEESQSAIDWVGFSQKGTWVLIGSEPDNGAPLTGFVIANRELTEFHTIGWATGHADVGLDSAGNEVLVMQNSRTDYIDMVPLDPATKPIADAEDGYEGTNNIPIVRLFYDSTSQLGLNSSVHVSCNAPGWALISTYAEPGMEERNWLDRGLLLVKLDANDPAVYLIAKTHNVTGDYWEETHGTITNDGRLVLWTANFGANPGSRQSFEMRLELPR